MYNINTEVHFLTSDFTSLSINLQFSERWSQSRFLLLKRPLESSRFLLSHISTTPNIKSTDVTDPEIDSDMMLFAFCPSKNDVIASNLVKSLAADHTDMMEL